MAVPVVVNAACTHEHVALLREYGRVQLRCSELVRAQAQEIQQLQADRMRLRAAVIVRDSALAWMADDRSAAVVDATSSDGFAIIEASLVAADLVICQTGCLSHGAYWRVQDHCKRTGKTCVLVERPAAVRIVRIGTAPDPHADAPLNPCSAGRSMP